ncbi:hypothetical protein [Comamonas sp. JC664]|uniref:hypothetical protein n=1 Tax=Comamonas sp. JC664 TaxID=2801917 RepID=UPI00360F0FBE
MAQGAAVAAAVMVAARADAAPGACRRRSHRGMESGQPVAKPGREPAFWAVELPEHMVLRKTVALPALDPQDCASAAELEVQAISPLPQTTCSGVTPS